MRKTVGRLDLIDSGDKPRAEVTSARHSLQKVGSQNHQRSQFLRPPQTTLPYSQKPAARSPAAGFSIDDKKDAYLVSRQAPHRHFMRAKIFGSGRQFLPWIPQHTNFHKSQILRLSLQGIHGQDRL